MCGVSQDKKGSAVVRPGMPPKLDGDFRSNSGRITLRYCKGQSFSLARHCDLMPSDTGTLASAEEMRASPSVRSCKPNVIVWLRPTVPPS